MIDFFKSSTRNYDVELTQWKLNLRESLVKEATFWTLGIEGDDLMLVQTNHDNGFPVSPNQRMKGFWRVDLPGKNPKEMEGWFGNYRAEATTVSKGMKRYKLTRLEDEGSEI